MSELTAVDRVIYKTENNLAFLRARLTSDNFEVLEIGPSSGVYNTRARLKIDLYPDDNGDIEPEDRYLEKPVSYNRFDIGEVLQSRLPKDDNKYLILHLGADPTVTEYAVADALIAYEILMDETKISVTHLKDNEFRLAAKPDNLRFIGACIITVPDYVVSE